MQPSKSYYSNCIYNNPPPWILSYLNRLTVIMCKSNTRFGCRFKETLQFTNAFSVTVTGIKCQAHV